MYYVSVQSPGNAVYGVPLLFHQLQVHRKQPTMTSLESTGPTTHCLPHHGYACA